MKKRKKLAEEIQVDHDVDPLETLNKVFKKWEDEEGVTQRLELQVVTPSTTARLIGKLGDSNAMGFDELEARVLKLAAVVLLNPITTLINLSIHTGSYPAKWKIGCVIPLHKGGNLDRQLPGSCRPITLLPAVSKIVERAIQEQVVKHMERNGFIHPNQHACRKGHSTTSALLKLADQLYEAAEEKEIGIALSINQSSAFDSICHKTLIRKLKKYGFDDNSSKCRKQQGRIPVGWKGTCQETVNFLEKL